MQRVDLRATARRAGIRLAFRPQFGPGESPEVQIRPGPHRCGYGECLAAMSLADPGSDDGDSAEEASYRCLLPGVELSRT